MEYLRIVCLSFAAICLAMISCDNDTLSDDKGQATVQVSLRSENGDIPEAGICLYYESASHTRCVSAEPTSAGHYSAMLPAGSISAKPFVEIHLEGAVYSYTPQEIRFEGNRQYIYSFVLTEKGLKLADSIDTNNSGWGIIEQEVVIY